MPQFFCSLNHLLSVFLDAQDICLACFLIPICAFILIFVIIVLVVVLVLGYLVWDKREKKRTPPDIQVSPKKEKVKAQDSLIISNPSAEITPIVSGFEDTDV